MKTLPKVFLGIAAALMLSACGESAEQKEAIIRANIQIMSEDGVKARLKDPSSAQFTNQFVSRRGAACGEVNSKNGFGGFTGAKRYIYAGKDLAIFESDMAAGEFDKSWDQLCT